MKLMIVSTFMAAMMGAGSALACDCAVKACEKAAANADAKKACAAKKGEACTCTDKKSCGCEKKS
ncbi:MAG: hypothetical protein K2X47_18260 [Bdellovibrionales bacterium]|nr:hypothetical protein [Bdellovibrionales bacterium]